MPLPESPQTREEMYLNGIATGSTDGLPDAPVTREEMYLDYIAKNGGGGGGGGGSSTLSGLTDVDISNPTDGQMLVYNATSGKWENGAGGGGGLVVHQTKGESGVYTLDKTWQEIANALLTGPVLLVYEDEYSGRTYSLLAYYVDPNDNYTVDFADQLFFTTESPSGYPCYIPD